MASSPEWAFLEQARLVGRASDGAARRRDRARGWMAVKCAALCSAWSSVGVYLVWVDGRIKCCAVWRKRMGGKKHGVALLSLAGEGWYI